ncbi:MAG: hypothetical protein V7632_2594 [Bradyrhizobium sp.]
MSSFTFSSKHWLYLFLSIVVTVVVTFGVASERMLRIYITPIDTYEWITSLLVSSSQPNAAFGDSHIAAVPDYNKPDFINLGIGGTTIRRMNDRVRYYYRNLQPGQVIIQADPHSFAEYRLEAQGSYVPEVYTAYRLRILDPRHRGFMLEYWLRFIRTGDLRPQAQPGYDALWEKVGNMLLSQPAETAKPAEGAAADQKANSDTQAASASEPHAAEGAAKAEPAAASPTPASTASPAPASAAAPAHESASELAKFNEFMDYEVNTHTPAANFRERDEARIYRELIAYLVKRGAKVCMVNYPVDKFYRERADKIQAFAETRKFYQEVARENGIPYVSFWARFDDPAMYQNTDHVNQNGSPILAREAREACFGKGGQS